MKKGLTWALASLVVVALAFTVIGGMPVDGSNQIQQENEAASMQLNADSAPTAVAEGEQASEKIEDEMTPLAGPASMALFNLILAIANAVAASALLTVYIIEKTKRSDYREDVDTIKRRGIAGIVSLLPGAAGIALYLLTEPWTGNIVMTDKWTMLMVVLTAAQTLVSYFSTKRDKDTIHYVQV